MVSRISAALPAAGERDQALGLVLGDAEAHRLAAMALDQRGKAARHRGDDLILGELGAGRHHLVARRKDRDLGLAANRKLSLVHGGGQHKLSRTKPCPR